MPMERNSVPRLEKQGERKLCLLDLPESSLDCILERLSPLELCIVAQVCASLRYRCRSDGLWEKLIQQKWGRLVGDVASREWQWHVTKINRESHLLQQNQSGSFGTFGGVWPLIALNSYLQNFWDLTSLFRDYPKLALYICLESGRFWFPAQVHKNPQLYCYDALVSYDSKTDTFRARSPTGGWRMIEQNIQWDRLRLSPAESSSLALHMSDCLNDLKPGDHIEIQRRKRREFPYDWWFGVIGHLDSCDKDVNHCRCQYSDMVVVEFKQYSYGTRWRRAVLNRNVSEEQGSRLCLYGGIRKLENEEEIERWNRLRTTQYQ